MTALRRISEISDVDLQAAYLRLGSVWAVGSELGVRGQSVHRRLKRAGVRVGNAISAQDLAAIKEYYMTTPPADFSLALLAKRLGRTKAVVCRCAAAMGLTDINRQMSQAHHAKFLIASKGKWKDRPHPRGMAGKRHTADTKAKVSAGSRLNWATWKTFGTGPMSPESLDRRSEMMSKRARSIPIHRQHTRARGGRRPDIGDTWFRSSWEANYARYLNLLKRMGVVESWEYEPQTFWFDGIKRGVVSYLPDFAVKYRDDERLEYIEIKGWVQAKDRVKWKRMAKYHPHIKLVIVKDKEYRAIAQKWASAIPEWESGKAAKLSVSVEKA